MRRLICVLLIGLMLFSSVVYAENELNPYEFAEKMARERRDRLANEKILKYYKENNVDPFGEKISDDDFRKIIQEVDQEIKIFEKKLEGEVAGKLLEKYSEVYKEFREETGKDWPSEKESEILYKDIFKEIKDELIEKYQSAPLIHTPFNSNNFKDTWQEKAVIYASNFWQQTGKGIGSWLGKIIQDDIDQKQKEMINRDPFLKLMYDKKLHDIEEYENLANKIKKPYDLEIVIDHIQEQQDIANKKGKKIPSEIEELKERLIHYKEYWENHEEEIEQNKAMKAMTISSAIMTVLAILGALAAGGLGVGA